VCTAFPLVINQTTFSGHICYFVLDRPTFRSLLRKPNLLASSGFAEKLFLVFFVEGMTLGLSSFNKFQVNINVDSR
jgi:hypothetical protein